MSCLRTLLSIAFFIWYLPIVAVAQTDYQEWDSDKVEGIYIKIKLDLTCLGVKEGTINKEGEELEGILLKIKKGLDEEIFVPASVKSGVYSIEIHSYYGYFYEIKGTDLYVKLRRSSHSSSEEGILEINNYGWSYFYEKP